MAFTLNEVAAVTLRCVDSYLRGIVDFVWCQAMLPYELLGKLRPIRLSSFTAFSESGKLQLI